MTRILAIETSSQACSVALAVDGDIMEKYEVMPRLHAQKLLPMIASLLSEEGCQLNHLDAIAFSRGPGSFTGIRIATSVAQGLAFGADLPLVPISTLATLAQAIYRQYQDTQIISVLDARMKEIYWGCFHAEESGVEPVGEEHMTQPEELYSEFESESRTEWVGVGDGWAEEIPLPDSLKQEAARIYHPCYPHALDVARLALRDFDRGLIVSPEQAQPVYMREKSAWRKSPKFTQR